MTGWVDFVLREVLSRKLTISPYSSAGWLDCQTVQYALGIRNHFGSSSGQDFDDDVSGDTCMEGVAPQ